MKKIIIVILALVIALSFCTIAFAENELLPGHESEPTEILLNASPEEEYNQVLEEVNLENEQIENNEQVENNNPVEENNEIVFEAPPTNEQLPINELKENLLQESEPILQSVNTQLTLLNVAPSATVIEKNEGLSVTGTLVTVPDEEVLSDKPYTVRINRIVGDTVQNVFEDTFVMEGDEILFGFDSTGAEFPVGKYQFIFSYAGEEGVYYESNDEFTVEITAIATTTTGNCSPEIAVSGMNELVVSGTVSPAAATGTVLVQIAGLSKEVPVVDGAYSALLESGAVPIGNYVGTATFIPLDGSYYAGSQADLNWSVGCVVTFETWGGTEIPGQLVKMGDTAGAPGTVPTLEGYIFSNWYADKSCKTLFDFNTPIMSDTIIYAGYRLNYYTVTYNVNGGYPIANQSYTIKSGLILPENALRTGYTFQGWFDNEELLGDPVTEIEVGETGARLFHAKWEPVTYKVKLDAMGGSIEDGKDVTSYKYGEGANLPSGNYVTRKFYTFAGWYENASYAGNPVSTIPTTATGDKVYYAKWNPTYFSLNFYKNASLANGRAYWGYSEAEAKARAFAQDTNYEVTSAITTFNNLQHDSIIYVYSIPNAGYCVNHTILSTVNWLEISSEAYNSTQTGYLSKLCNFTGDGTMIVSFSTHPQTGDASNIVIWISLMGACGLVAAAAFIASRKKSK